MAAVAVMIEQGDFMLEIPGVLRSRLPWNEITDRKSLIEITHFAGQAFFSRPRIRSRCG
jgi:hypothetical protein